MLLVKRYEQLCFHKQPVGEYPNEIPNQCLDRNGDVIQVGSYVKAVHGEAMLHGVEGIVKQIFSYEEAGYHIKLVTLGGKAFDDDYNPLFFEVIRR